MNTQKTKERINRRSFLHSAAGVGAGLVFSPIVSGQKSSSK
ncbi:MAG: twin-arginine translocation signal domain-containing protein, partial [Planctomycetes bacterium]|nr:twin-arginine translocation signal domain-containing protein [Planctomycetota bacterium]